jgi:hypothetical protein
MRNPAVILAFMLLGVSATAAAGQIYQCEENGRKVFSQQPCGADAKVVKSENAERSVVMSASMSGSDINYLCSLAMRSWERQAEESRNRKAVEGYYYYSGSSDRDERRRAFVLSHIENLEKIASNDPELYEIANSIANRSYYGNPSSYTYDAERAKAQKACLTDVQYSIERLQSRQQAEDDQRFRRRK